jgi:hypothetical protein
VQEQQKQKTNRYAKPKMVRCALRLALKVLIANTFQLHHHRSNNEEVGWPAILAFWTLGHHRAIHGFARHPTTSSLVARVSLRENPLQRTCFLVSKGIEKGHNDLPGAPIENYIPLSAMLHANQLPLSLPADLVLNPH